ncbi:4Fe-4S dicluster domain-containing protein [Chloroflexota bacterium]
MQKCTLCHHRIEQGLAPFSVLCCETGAMFFGDIDDPASEVSRLIAQKGASVLKPEAGTKPAVMYCPSHKTGWA